MFPKVRQVSVLLRGSPIQPLTKPYSADSPPNKWNVVPPSLNIYETLHVGQHHQFHFDETTSFYTAASTMCDIQLLGT